MGWLDNMLGSEGSLNFLSAAYTNLTNRYLANKQNQWNLEQLHYMNNYNSPLQQMNRLKKAGLNPNLVYGSGNITGNQSGMVQSANLANQKDMRLGDIFASAAKGYMTAKNFLLDYSKSTQELKNLREDFKVKAANARKINADAAIQEKNYNYVDTLQDQKVTSNDWNINNSIQNYLVNYNSLVRQQTDLNDFLSAHNSNPELFRNYYIASKEVQLLKRDQLSFLVHRILPSQLNLNRAQLSAIAAGVEKVYAEIDNLGEQNLNLQAQRNNILESTKNLQAQRNSINATINKIAAETAGIIQKNDFDKQRFEGWTSEDWKELVKTGVVGVFDFVKLFGNKKIQGVKSAPKVPKIKKAVNP